MNRYTFWIPAVLAALTGSGILIWFLVDSDAGGAQVTPPSASKVTVNPASIDAPSYSPPESGANVGAATTLFADAMSRYQKRDYASASVSLRQASILEPGNPEIRFFLGISYLLTNDTTAGISELRVVQKLGESPYLDRVHFYLAKALLRQKDPAAALRELAAMGQGEGNMADAANRLKIQVANAYQ
jgi:cytochrome c-type biogenesis protein CcmH/NrfG